MMQSPSDALAALAAQLWELEKVCDPATLAIWLDKFSEEEASRHETPPSEWTLDAADLFGELTREISEPLVQITTFEEFASSAALMQSLDRWHAPLTMQGRRQAMTRTSDHDAAEDRLALEGAFGASDHGSIIPGSALDGVPRGEVADGKADFDWKPLGGAPGKGLPPTAGPGLVPQLLDHTAFLPRQVEIEEPDGSSVWAGRQLRLTYRRIARLAVWSPTVSDQDLVVAIAPLLEAVEDAAIIPTPDNKRYGVVPACPSARLEFVVEAAMASGAHMLLIPETCLDGVQLNELGAKIRSAAGQHQRSHGHLPQLRHVFVGVSQSPANPTVSRGANYVVLLDGLGVELCRQNKIHRWDFDANQLSKFGLKTMFPGVAAPFEEDIVGAEEIFVLDIDGLGRLLNLICADANSNSPGDWLLSQLRLDWVYAPIMDHSIANDVKSWITKRAYRAALIGSARVIVTNSMVLTHLVNASNLAAHAPFAQVEQCGVAFLVDGAGDQVRYCRLTADMSAKNIFLTAKWGDGWEPIDTLNSSSLSIGSV